MASHDLEALTNQCKANDVDAKVDAVTKLQRAFEDEVELNDPEALISALKICLRSSNQLLTTATLTLLPTFFSLAATGSLHDPNAPVDTNILRQIVMAFLPSGGLIDKMGENRQRMSEKARDAMVVLGGLAARGGTSSLGASVRGRDPGKGPETPFMIWERLLREGGLQSKVWKVREQSLLVLCQTRREGVPVPLKPLLPVLVDLLEDTDGTVRECARQTVVELFTGPNVTDAARADLKREMAKKNVRKTIVDSVQLKLMSSGGTGPGSSIGSPAQSDSGFMELSEPSGKKDYIPPSLKLLGRPPTAMIGNPVLSRTVSASQSGSVGDANSRPGSRLGGELPITPTSDSGEVAVVYIASARDMDNEFVQMLKPFDGKETEHNWAPRERAIQRIRGMIRGGAHERYSDVFLSHLKGGMVDASFKTLVSLRTTVAVCTCHMFSELAVALGASFDSLSEPVLSRLAGMATLTKKIVATLSQQTFDTIVLHTNPQPRAFTNMLYSMMQDKAFNARQFAISHIKVFLETHGQRVAHSMESSGAMEALEKTIKKGLADSNPGVRESSRTTFWIFDGIWHERGQIIMGTLDASAKKQLEKACPVPGKVSIPTTPAVKKSSVAAAIAASRAKAKALATAPPTLRHQVTAPDAIPQSPTPLQAARSTTSPKDGLYTIRRPSATRPISPLSPPARKVSGFSPSSSYSGGFAPTSSHVRTRSTDAPPSPSAQHRRFASSQLSSPSSPRGADTLRKASQTALPPSPRTSLEKTVTPVTPPRPRPASPTRIPSPSSRMVSGRGKDGRSSFFALAQQRNMNGIDESLLLAQQIPLPDDSESDDDSQMLSFSAPFEKYHMSVPKTMTSSMSTDSAPATAPEPIVEDALRARAEQAESAAERLLELNEPDDESHISPIPASLLRTNGDDATPKASNILKQKTNAQLPTTPVTKKTLIFRQAAAFQNSPASKKPVSLVDVLRERKHESGWWLKRVALVDKGSPLKGSDAETQLKELKRCVVALEDGSADIAELKKVALICSDNPSDDASGSMASFSFSSGAASNNRLTRMQETIWSKEKLFDRMFDALLAFLTPDKSEGILEYGLIAVWEILDNQSSLAEGREAAVFSELLKIRYCNRINVLEATNTIRDALVERVEPVYGLTTLHASVRAFHSEPPPLEKQEEKSASYAFGLIALGKFILRLPAEILEDELPRLKQTLTTALSDSTSLVVRESAATCIIASQLVLRDETHLFSLLDGLPEEKMNLLTYLFDKHGARVSPASTSTASGFFANGNGNGAPGTDKLAKEMRRLDGRTNTPPRPKAPVGLA